MSDETRLLDRIHDTLQTQGYQPMTTYEQAVISGQGLTSRIEHWIGPRGTRLIQVSIVYGVVSDVEVLRTAGGEHQRGRHTEGASSTMRLK